MGSSTTQERLSSINAEFELENQKEESETRPQSPVGGNCVGRRRKSVQFTSRPTIVFDSASKSYGKRAVLRNINITVKESTIYGLYGKCGSGKTTALSCLLGIQSLDSGNIFVRGLKTGSKGSGIPGKRIGYMPQSTSLHEELNMRETLHYYGRIYGMSYEDVEEKRRYFIDLLQLEPCKSQIRNLSEDQKQLVSFTVALLHQPEILVMDEPTINMDPLPRENVWQHVRDLVAESRTTVIVASACAFEVQHADMIGILRCGRLLEEGSPSSLFSKFDTNSLENVILKICQQDHLEQSSQNRWNSIDVTCKDKDAEGNSPWSGKTMAGLLRQSTWNVGRKDLTTVRDKFQALFLKNVLLAYRTLCLILFLFILPSATICFVSMSLSHLPRDIKFGYVNNETYASVGLGNQNARIQDKCGSARSCQFLKRLEEETLNLIHFSSETEALDNVLDGSIWGYLAFSPELLEDGAGGEETPGVSSRNFSKPFVKVSLDNSNAPVAMWLREILSANMYATFMDPFFETQEKLDRVDSSPFLFESVLEGGGNLTLSSFIVPGVTLHVVGFYAALISALALLYEMQNGKFARIATVGVCHFEILVAHLSFMLFLLIGQTLLSFFTLVYFFHLPRLGSLLLGFCLVITHGISGIFLGVLTATVLGRAQYVVLFLLAAAIPTFLISGTLSPLEGLPWALKYAGYVYPGTLPGLGFKSILLRGWGLSQFGIWIAFGSTFAYSIAYFVFTYIYRLCLLVYYK